MRFAAAWERGDQAAMWRALSPAARRAVPERRFITAYRNAHRAAGVRRVATGRLGAERNGRIAVPVAIRTDVFKTLRGTLAFPVSGSGDEAGVDWNYALRMPGLRRDEAVVRESGRAPRRALDPRRGRAPARRHAARGVDRRALGQRSRRACSACTTTASAVTPPRG